MGFKPGKTVMRGWLRTSPPPPVTFWFQVTQFGFDKHTGGKFIVEFTANDPIRGTSLRYRLWRLLNDRSRREVVALNNEVIASLPGPSTQILNGLPEFLRLTYLASFEPTIEADLINSDVWFRYATSDHAARWGDFVAKQLPTVVSECERRLAELAPDTASMAGVIFKPNKQSD
jgi:hypothetical protein